MTPAALRRKYTDEKLNGIRKLFDQDVEDWAETKKQRQVDLQCISTDTGDANFVAGPWPEAEWKARHAAGNERPCLHEDVLTQFVDMVINDIEANPMGIEATPAGEGADKETATFLENRIRQIENEEQGSIAYLTAAKNAVQGSYGWFKLEEAYRQGLSRKLTIVEIDDPDSIVPGYFKRRDARDLRRVWELERMTHEEFIERYPSARVRSFDALRTEMPQWIDATTIQVAAWWHFDIDEREMLRIEDLEQARGFIDVFGDEVDPRAYEGRILERRMVSQKRVMKTIINGVEALDETEWMDPGDGDALAPEIPFFLVAGRIKYQDNVRTIDSLVRKGRVGQLLYDFIISSEQEEIAQMPKAKAWGPEGSFDTNTDWRTITRSPVAFAEYKLVAHPETGQAAPGPEFIQYEPKIQAFELAKQSCLVGIQNAIGMQSTERQDRTAKSGKAIEALQQTMTAATAHYFGALRLAQERMYRVLQRMLPDIECDEAEVAIRDKFGKCQMVQPQYLGRHFVSVATGRRYQTLQDKQEEASQELLQIGDPTILLAVLPGALRMRGLGEYGEQLAMMIEAIQPPPMQQVRQGQPVSPQAIEAVQQAQQALQALNAQCQQLESQIGQLQAEKQAKIIENQFMLQKTQEDNRRAIAVAEIQASVKEDIGTLNQQVSAIRHIMDFLTEKFKLQHDAAQSAADRAHEHIQNALDRTHEAAENEANRAEAQARTQVMAENLATPEAQQIASAEGPISP